MEAGVQEGTPRMDVPQGVRAKGDETLQSPGGPGCTWPKAAGNFSAVFPTSLIFS